MRKYHVRFLEGKAPAMGLTYSTVEYRTERNSEFDTLISTTATIHLLVKNPPTYLYTKDYLNTQVCIYVEGESLPVFAGYLSPMNFSQSFESEWDEIDINCIDYIATLKYRNFTKDSSWLSLSEILLFAFNNYMPYICLLYTSDDADERYTV